MVDTKYNINDNDSHSDKVINVPRMESIEDMKGQKKTLRYSTGVSQKIVWSLIGVPLLVSAYYYSWLLIY
ncbi:MAG: hypothetical protein P8H89_07240 [Porticoccaceae bacterium]|nr:hypothetical protein [Porticoccaceae bacterium]